jgi:hypothetical protein
MTTNFVFDGFLELRDLFSLSSYPMSPKCSLERPRTIMLSVVKNTNPSVFLFARIRAAILSYMIQNLARDWIESWLYGPRFPLPPGAAGQRCNPPSLENTSAISSPATPLTLENTSAISSTAWCSGATLQSTKS